MIDAKKVADALGAEIVKPMKGTDRTPDGQVWICYACGKKSRTRYGFDATGARASISPGWDESCMMNAVLVYDAASPPYRAVPGPDNDDIPTNEA